MSLSKKIAFDPKEDLKYNPGEFPNTSLIYKNIGYPKDLIQLKLFRSLDEFKEPEGMISILDTFELDINYQDKDYKFSYLIAATALEK